MERLLADAEKLQAEMGNTVDYDISSYSDIIAAIHTIQEDLGIANATAEEAETTITGSINTLKAAFDNLLAGLGNAEADVQGLIDNIAVAFDNVVKNISPVVDNIISALPSAFSKISDAIGELLPGLLTTVTGAASEIIITLADGIADNIDVIISAATTIFETLVSTAQALIPTLQDVAVELVSGLCDFVTSNISDVVQLGLDMINAICEGIAEALPVLIPAALNAVLQIVDTLANNIDMVVETAGKLLDGLAKGLTDKKNLELLVEDVPQIVIKIADKLIEAIPEILRFTGDFLGKIADELINFDWSETAKQVMDNVANALEEAQRNVSVVLDNIFTGGEVYGGDTENVSMSYDGFGSPDSIRENAEEVADAIGEGQEWIADKYNKGKKIIDDAVGKGTSPDPETQKSVMDGYAANARNAAQAVGSSTADIGDSLSEASSAAEDTGSAFNGMAESTSQASEDAGKSLDKLSEKSAKTTAKISDDFRGFYEALSLAKAKGEISDDEYIARLKKKLESSAEYDDPVYKRYWNEVTTAEKRAAETAAKAEEQAEKERQAKREKLQKEFEQKREQAAKERLKQQQETANAELTQFKSDTDKLTSEYKSKLSELQSERDSFQNKLSENIFKTETVTDSRTGETKTVGGTVNLQKKIAARKELGKYLESLVKKGIPKGMLSELAAMDPSEGLQFAKQLDGMKDDKWQSLVADYNDYEAVNKQIADQVYGPQITALNQQYASDMTALMDTVTEGAASAGAQTVKEFIKGVDLTSDDALSQIESKISEVGDSISEAISDGSMFEKVDTTSAGETMMNGIAKGIISKSDVLKKAFEKALSNIDIMATLKAAVDLKTSGYTPASTSTVTNNTIVNNNNTYTTAPTAQSGSNGVTNLTVNLLWKDGTKLAEIVNSANNRIAISTGG